MCSIIVYMRLMCTRSGN